MEPPVIYRRFIGLITVEIFGATSPANLSSLLPPFPFSFDISLPFPFSLFDPAEKHERGQKIFCHRKKREKEEERRERRRRDQEPRRTRGRSREIPATRRSGAPSTNRIYSID